MIQTSDLLAPSVFPFDLPAAQLSPAVTAKNSTGELLADGITNRFGWPRQTSMPAQMSTGTGRSLRDAAAKEGRPTLLVGSDELELHVPGFSQTLRAGLAGERGRAAIRAGRGFHQSELGRAIGRRSDAGKVFDLTAGLGRDALTLAHGGWEVLAVEREPVLALLLQSVVLSYEGTLDVRVCCAEAQFAASQVTEHDVVYLDPMFTEGLSRAAPQHEMQLLRALLPADEKSASDGGGQLLTAIGATGPRRIVLKRPTRAASLTLPGYTDHQIKGKRVRFDVYVRRPQ